MDFPSLSEQVESPRSRSGSLQARSFPVSGRHPQKSGARLGIAAGPMPEFRLLLKLPTAPLLLEVFQSIRIGLYDAPDRL